MITVKKSGRRQFKQKPSNAGFHAKTKFPQETRAGFKKSENDRNKRYKDAYRIGRYQIDEVFLEIGEAKILKKFLCLRDVLTGAVCRDSLEEIPMDIDTTENLVEFTHKFGIVRKQAEFWNSDGGPSELTIEKIEENNDSCRREVA